MTAGLLLIVLLIGGVALIVAGARQPRQVPGSGVRRVFQYAVLYGLFVTAANGTENLLGMAFGAEIPSAWPEHSYALAQSLTNTFVALPLAAALAWWTRRSHQREPREADSLLYGGYLGAVSLTGLVFAASSVHALATALLLGEGIDPRAAGGVLAWGGLWAGHWMIRFPRGVKAAHDLLGAVIGLTLGAAGLFMLLDSALDVLRGLPVLAGGPYELASAAGLLLAGATAWLLYWPWRAARLPRTAAWHTYVLLLGVAGGLVLTLFGAGALLWRALVGIIGDPAGAGMWTDWPAHAAAVVTGLTLWWYHRALLVPAERNPVRAVYAYLVAGIGLAAAATGVGIVVVAVVEAITPAVGNAQTSRNTLLAAITLLLIGAPLWWIHWRAAGEEQEHSSFPRRVYLIVVIGVGGVAALISLILAVSGAVQEAVETGITLATVRMIKTPLGVFLASLAAAGFHARALRTDLLRVGAEGLDRKRSITLVGPEDHDLAEQVRSITGAQVNLLVTAHEGPPWDWSGVISALEGEGDRLLIADSGKVHAYAVRPVQTGPDSRDNPGAGQ